MTSAVPLLRLLSRASQSKQHPNDGTEKWLFTCPIFDNLDLEDKGIFGSCKEGREKVDKVLQEA